ncbi:MAG: hypothetical protein KAH23_01945 [Kiritimatiellae bacterium]|nr:hypothetical protein [Kiritimatiellia bacterium]
MNIRICFALLFVTLGASPCLAGGNLSIRMIEASNKTTPSSSGVQDVVSILEKSLPYNSFNLSASGTMKLPAKKSTQRLGGYTVSCSGKQKNLSIKVTHEKKTILNTTVNLRDNKPLILGGFPSENGKLILVFVVS